MEAGQNEASVPFRHLARAVLTTFLLTFIAARALVILIMERKLPDFFFLHLGGTHVHHLNYGIFILSVVGAVLLFAPLSGRQRWWCAVAYGFGMALTFDEFGMWVHLGGGYWQRASFDAVIVILGLMGMLGFAPSWDKMRAHHWLTGVGTVIVTALFYALLFKSLGYADKMEGVRFEELERSGPQ